MASLRSLLDYASVEDFFSPTYIGDDAHQILFRGNHCWAYGSSEDYGWQCFLWSVPNGCVCKVKFEIWAGGGGGSGACCCTSGGLTGHSGQYAQHTVCASAVSLDSLDAVPYSIFVASGTCRAPGQNSGYDGCKSYVTGCGLSNFCACGGCHGSSWCFGNSCGTFPITTCGTGAASCRWRTDCYTRPDSASYLQNQSACELVGSDFWGGGMSYRQSDCSDNGNWCMVKTYRPIPGRLNSGVVGSKLGTLVTQRIPTMGTCGRDQTLWYTANSGGLSGDCWRNGPPGSGGVSANSASSCCCGSEGAHGLVKITWYCKS